MAIDRNEEVDETDENNNTILSDNKYFFIEKNSDRPHFSYVSGAGGSYSLSIDGFSSAYEQPAEGDEIAIFDDAVCVGAGVVTGIWPLSITAWKDNAGTQAKDGYTAGNNMEIYFYDGSREREYLAEAYYLKGNGTFESDEAAAANLSGTEKIVLPDGVEDTYTIKSDTAGIAFAFRGGGGVTISFGGGLVSGKRLYITQSANPSDNIPDGMNFETPLYYVYPSIEAQGITAAISFEYRDDMLIGKSISESDLIVAAWDSENQTWDELSSTIDTEANTLTTTVNTFSVYAVVSSKEKIITAIESLNRAAVSEFALSPNYPNPFNPVTSIRFQIPLASDVTLTIYNIIGQEVRVLLNEHMTEGNHEVQWDGIDNLGKAVASGIYFYRLSTDSGFMEAKKMALIR